ncbi:3-oxoacyl-[acyl-carrier-protein] synthase 2 [Rosistilla carotiformis]|uniref:3-oxoacyl-[acyl-carrier-protein] synthase 2 n=1 Tax=Rosistilla carotiformis TaxID=2528017 RepID=A0A518JRV0_9BACT|nr:beta-ketoacyl synthase N-terminal-like domain-containing protein [Rosistilla carotiformis]QDV68282.1 3-oxoacyl-[acyl-carrier-protein] synthase 2 [Rosistilla carotiformis]
MVLRKDVVITGIGVVSPIGTGVDRFWSSLIEGRSGIRNLTHVTADMLPYTYGGQLTDFDPKAYVRPRKTLKVMSRELQTAFSACVMATQQSGFDVAGTPKERIATVFGSEMLYGEPEEIQPTVARSSPEGRFQPELWGPSAMKEIFPLWMLKYLPNMAACHYGIAIGALGPNNTIVMGDTSGLSAVAESISVIQRGAADVVVTCSTGTRISLTRLLYQGSVPYGSLRDPVGSSCRPFSSDRDGLIGGEGAAAVILESREHAERRGAKPLVSIGGYSCNYGAPAAGRRGSPEALSLAIGSAIERAGATPEEIGIAVSHAMGDPMLDQIDAQVHQSIVPQAIVTAPKGAMGHLGAGCGVMEMSIAALALQHGIVPPTVNAESKDPQYGIDLAAAPRPTNASLAVQSNHSATGNAIAVVLRKE